MVNIRCALVVFVTVLVASVLAAPTTPDIAAIFIGRCYEKAPNFNCSELWAAFSSAAMLPNTVVNDTYYEPFFAIANFVAPKNNALFWSGNMPLSHSLADGNSRYTTLEETNTGYVLNGLSWCGVPAGNPPAFDYVDNCLFTNASDPSYYGTRGVWVQCSAHFAQGASGLVTVLLQPSYLNGAYIAYRNNSLFYTVELPSMIPGQVTGVTIFLIKNETTALAEQCGSGSLLQLAADVKSRLNVTITCVDDANVIRTIFCTDNAQASTCVALSDLAPESEEASSSPSNTQYLGWAIALTVVGGVALIAVGVLTTLLVKGGAYGSVRTNSAAKP